MKYFLGSVLLLILFAMLCLLILGALFLLDGLVVIFSCTLLLGLLLLIAGYLERLEKKGD